MGSPAAGRVTGAGMRPALPDERRWRGLRCCEDWWKGVGEASDGLTMTTTRPIRTGREEAAA